MIHGSCCFPKPTSSTSLRRVLGSSNAKGGSEPSRVHASSAHQARTSPLHVSWDPQQQPQLDQGRHLLWLQHRRHWVLMLPGTQGPHPWADRRSPTGGARVPGRHRVASPCPCARPLAARIRGLGLDPTQGQRARPQGSLYREAGRRGLAWVRRQPGSSLWICLS